MLTWAAGAADSLLSDTPRYEGEATLQRLLLDSAVSPSPAVRTFETVLRQVTLNHPDKAGFVVNDRRTQQLHRIHDQASSMAVNVPCQV